MIAVGGLTELKERLVRVCLSECSVARKFAGTRTMTVFRTHVEDSFREYGTAAKTKNRMKRARARECEKNTVRKAFMLTLLI